jgi:hypothetical protein
MDRRARSLAIVLLGTLGGCVTPQRRPNWEVEVVVGITQQLDPHTTLQDTVTLKLKPEPKGSRRATSSE